MDGKGQGARASSVPNACRAEYNLCQNRNTTRKSVSVLAILIGGFMIQTVQAIQFHRFMGTGRTTPALCGCEDAGGNPAGDFIVKLRGGLERGGTGLAAELIASRLAAYFGIPAPSPVLVFIASDFANSVSLAYPDKSKRLAGSIGLNFGSSQLNDVTTWPVDKAILNAMWPTAASIYAFDALIQNPDRRLPKSVQSRRPDLCLRP